MRDPNRTSIFLSPALAEEKQRVSQSGGGFGLSGRLTTVLGRLKWVVYNHTPDFLNNEWCLIFDALNGYALFEDHAIGGIPLQISDSIELDGLDEKWGVNAESFLAQVGSLSAAELVAVAEINDLFWSDTNQDRDEFLQKIHDRKLY